jgi:flavin reductase (DIM6/NTAB) family NADH-FMN oxidoreductase RutF
MSSEQRSIPIPTGSPVWSSFFTVAPLVLVASRESNGGYDIAPKHMAMPLGWQNYYCFVCSPRHATQRNIEATREFTVSFPRAEQIVQTSMAAAPRQEDDSKPSLAALETFPATTVAGVLVKGAYLWLECTHGSPGWRGGCSIDTGRRPASIGWISLLIEQCAQ